MCSLIYVFYDFTFCSTFTNLSNELLQDVHLRSPTFDGELDSFDSNSVCSPHPSEDSASTSLMSDLAPDSVQQSPLVAEGIYNLCYIINKSIISVIKGLLLIAV